MENWSQVQPNTTLASISQKYGNWDCQASKGFDKHIRDDDAGFVDTQIYI